MIRLEQSTAITTCYCGQPYLTAAITVTTRCICNLLLWPQAHEPGTS